MSRDRRAGVIAAMARFDQRARAGKVKAPKAKPAKRGKVRRWPTERDEQKAILKWLRERGCQAWAVPNQAGVAVDAVARDLCEQCGPLVRGRLREALRRHWANLRGDGVVRGAPDLVVRELAPRDGRPVLLEVKRVREARPQVSEDQRALHAAHTRAGWHVVVAFGAADGVAQLEALGF